MDQHHAKKPLAVAAVERLGQSGNLLAAEPPGRQEGRRGRRRRQSDQGERPAPTHERKRRLAGIIPAHIFAPVELRMARGGAHVDVVIARHQGDVARRPERREPGARRRVFARKRDVDEVAGHGDVVRRLRLEIRHDAREQVGAVNEPALALPVEKAGRAFAHELGQSGRRQRSEMGVRQMRKDEHGTHHRTP